MAGVQQTDLSYAWEKYMDCRLQGADLQVGNSGGGKPAAMQPQLGPRARADGGELLLFHRSPVMVLESPPRCPPTPCFDGSSCCHHDQVAKLASYVWDLNRKLYLYNNNTGSLVFQH